MERKTTRLINDILSEYQMSAKYKKQVKKAQKENLKQAEEKFKVRTGKKNLRGFEKSKEFKRVTSKLRRSARYYQKKEVETLEERLNFSEIIPYQIFHTVLSYGGKINRAIENYFVQTSINNPDKEVVFIGSIFGNDLPPVKTEREAKKKLKEMYDAGLEAQSLEEKKYPMANLETADYKNYILLKSNLI